MSRQDMEQDIDATETRRLVRNKNKKSGGFQSMGLSYFVLKGITSKGYKIPTPIQRKAIPVILEGRDVVAMARTGSGKTAAFLIPVFERLQRHSTGGPRALIMSPTRELALQTLKFTRELGRFSQLKAVIILGGDKIEDQFSAMHEHPDIIIATPGRFLHVCVEMSLRLAAVEMVIFDEADRLFELGFAAQLDDILRRLPATRQTLLLSATLPRLLVDFAKAGLHDPHLLRLDVDTALSPRLQNHFLMVRPHDKAAALLSVLDTATPEDGQAVVFAAVARDVEFLHALLAKSGRAVTMVYSSLDPEARRLNTARFRSGDARVLVVTDLAARGIDIPHLACVVNFNFPARPKLFLHRVGRVARAGAAGSAFSLLSADELPYLLDLHVFLGRALRLSRADSGREEGGLVGRVPARALEEAADRIRRLQADDAELTAADQRRGAAYAKYLRTRPLASAESVRRAKELTEAVEVLPHPLFAGGEEEQGLGDILARVRAFKASSIFEATNAKSGGGGSARAAAVMRETRAAHQQAVQRAARRRAEPSAWVRSALRRHDAPDDAGGKAGRKRSAGGQQFVRYCPADARTEAGLGVASSFARASEEATLDLVPDEEAGQARAQVVKRWDKKKKRFVGPADVGGKMGKIKTESGAWIAASYKTDVYAKWLKRNRGVEEAREEEEEEEEEGGRRKRGVEVLGTRRKGGKLWHTGGKQKTAVARNEIKRPEQVLKERKRKERLTKFMKKRESMRKGKKGKAGRR